ncbi:sigma-70 family RNA polymerase sigma factor [Microbacterium sp. Root166]|uniref:RNA polymerase sigma factor n=1 Tax=Microbacterium sp. Root166 TaxID=1736478 RepID=UPI0009ECAB1F
MPKGQLTPELRDWVEVVIADNADALLRYLRRRVDQPEDAADLLGRALLAIWENGNRLPTTDQDARMWCFGVARNVLREHYRQTAKQLALADGMRQYLRSRPQKNAADTVAEARMASDALRQALVTLDPRSRELVLLVHWDGFSIAEAARVLGMNESSARSRHARTLRSLEKQLAQGQVAPAPQAGSEPRPATTAVEYGSLRP